jgi:hypothetical protein
LARLYLDHNVSLRAVPAILADGHDVVSTHDLGAALRPDDAQLLFAAQDGRIVVTLDRHDLTMLHDAWLSWPRAYDLALPPHSGILVVDSTNADNLARTIVAFLAASSSEQLANGLFWWHHLDGWRRRVATAAWEPHP